MYIKLGMSEIKLVTSNLNLYMHIDGKITNCCKYRWTKTTVTTGSRSIRDIQRYAHNQQFKYQQIPKTNYPLVVSQRNPEDVF
mgnify:CR=1 FL=1